MAILLIALPSISQCASVGLALSKDRQSLTRFCGRAGEVVESAPKERDQCLSA